MSKNEKQKKRVILGCCIAVIIFLLVMVFMFLKSDRSKVNELLDLGQKYLEELDYESAILVFDEAIAIDPKCAEAYLGKAKAQYALEQYQDAIDTLEEGIRQVDDSSELEAFLQRILNELSAGNAVVQNDTEENTLQEENPLQEANTPLLLNYTEIVRSIDTENPTIQLEVLGGTDAKDYVWESSNPECATVSDTGLVTCLPVEGRADISVKRDSGSWDKESCSIIIYDPASEYPLYKAETESFRIASEDIDQKQYFSITVSGEEGEQKVTIGNFTDYVYYSGDVQIPEQLTYKNEKVSITEISNRAFNWCNTMESVFIPVSISNVGNSYQYNPFYYCTRLKEIKVDEQNAYFQSIDGVLYSKDGKELIAYPAAKDGNTYTIPKEVEKVYTGAFTGCKNLEEILVEEGNRFYESIDGALMDKSNNWLEAYPIGNKASSYSIPDYITGFEDVFYMSELEEIVWKSATYINISQFKQCNQLKRIEGGSKTRRIILQAYGDSREIEIGGIEEMKDLEYLSFVLSETQDIDSFRALQQLKELDVNVSGREVDLQALGNLTNLESLQIREMENMKDLSWLAGMEQLREISFITDYNEEKMERNYINKDLNLQVLKSLKNLDSLYINSIESIDNLSWLAGMEGLERIDLQMKKSEINDLAPLFELQDLRFIRIYCEEDVVDDGIKEQVEELRKAKPEADIYIFNM